MASQPAEPSANPVAVIRQNLTAMEPEFKAALPPHIPVEKFARVAMTAIQQTPALVTADRRALFGAFVRLAQDGLLPDGREAAVVMFGNKPQAMPMIAGILKKIRQSGEVASVDCHVVYANDRFTYRPGIDQQPIFEPDWFADRGEPIGAYAIAVLKSGEVVPPEIMNVEQIEKVRKVSRAANNGPWVSWWSEMARKTVMRRFAKRLPSSTDLDDYFSRDETMATTLTPVRNDDPPPERPASRLDVIEQQIEHQPKPDAIDAEVIDEQANDLEERIEEDQPAQVNDEAPSEKTAAEQAVDDKIAEMKAAKTSAALEKIIKTTESHRAFMPDDQLIKLDIAIDNERRRFDQPELVK